MSQPSSPSRKYRSIGDAVLEQAAEDAMSTDDGVRFLELAHIYEDRTAGAIHGAANMYLAALSIIREQQKKLSALSEKKAIHYERRPELDKRFSHGDGYAGDAWVRWVVPGHKPEDAA
jgi:hypothetical protein